MGTNDFLNLTRNNSLRNRPKLCSFFIIFCCLISNASSKKHFLSCFWKLNRKLSLRTGRPLIDKRKERKSNLIKFRFCMSIVCFMKNLHKFLVSCLSLLLVVISDEIKNSCKHLNYVVGCTNELLFCFRLNVIDRLNRHDGVVWKAFSTSVRTVSVRC